jgi:hypothetical protein
MSSGMFAALIVTVPTMPMPTDCGNSTDYKEVITAWPDRFWHVGTESTAPYPDDWQPNGTFVELNTWYVWGPDAGWHSGLSAESHDPC